MKKILIFLTFIILIEACAKQSDLTIYNDTDHSIRIIMNGTIHQLLSNDPPAVETFYLNSFILFGETIDVPIIINGQIYLEHKEFTMEMKPNKNRFYHVELDKAGLQISNPSIYTITNVQLRKEGENDREYIIFFFPNIYSEELSPTMSVSEDYDFIRIQYQLGNDQYEYSEDEIDLNIGETITYVFEGN